MFNHTKRPFDLPVASIASLILAFPVAVFALLIFFEDWKSPFYIKNRVGKNGRTFRFIKLRTMRIDADRSGIDTTIDNDPRITVIGKWLRKTKADEFPQFWHVLAGTMSLVGPRPNIETEVALYTEEEQRLLTVQPGITDLSSIVFNNLGEILKNQQDPNIAYAQLVRPWKSRLGLWYIDNRSFGLDLQILYLTAVSLVWPVFARRSISKLLARHGAEQDLISLPLLTNCLRPIQPPGSERLLTKSDREAALSNKFLNRD